MKKILWWSYNFLLNFQDIVKGVIVVQSRGELPHNGISLSMEGVVNLQLSAKSVGVFEAFYNSLKPIQLVNYSLEIAKPGKLYHSMFHFKLSLLSLSLF